MAFSALPMRVTARIFHLPGVFWRLQIDFRHIPSAEV
jgi:hypothetical protein